MFAKKKCKKLSSVLLVIFRTTITIKVFDRDCILYLPVFYPSFIKRQINRKIKNQTNDNNGKINK